LVRQNRGAEKQIERDRDQWLLGAGQTTATKDNNGSQNAEPSRSTDDYVPASSKLMRIGALLEKEWNKNEP